MDYDPSSWEALNDKLDTELGITEDAALEQTDSAFDQEIKDKLENAQQPYDADSWDVLSDKLDKDEDLRHRILRIGFMQIIAVLLLILSLWNWKGAEMVQQKKQQAEEKTEILFAFLQLHEDFYKQFSSELDQPRSLVEMNQSIFPLNKVQSRTKYSESIVSTGNVSSIETFTMALLGESSGATESTIDESLLIKTNSSEASSGLTPIAKKQEKSAPIAALELDQKLLPEIPREAEPNEQLLLDFKLEEDSRIERSITGVFSPDLYLIRSADDPIYPLPSYFTDSYGLSGGALFNIKKNDLEVETGVLYSSVSYTPRHISERYSSRGEFFETSLNTIFFNTISIPLRFKYHWDVGQSSTFYTILGSSFNAVINSNFDIQNTIIAAPLNELAQLTPNRPRLEQKDFDPGIFEGGDIFDNAFFTADVGIGFEQRVANRLSLYVQPVLSTQFSAGIGPNDDKLHRASIFLGAKYHLN
jgi:hypothetical protein